MDLINEYDRAAAARDAALEQVEANTPDGWQEAAVAWLAGFLLRHETYFPDTDNRACPAQPPQLRAWGIITRHAIKAGWIRPTEEFRPRTRGHCTPGRVYQSLIFQGGR